ncbi:MAG: shikimate 5-dehydrogenase [Dermatophilaceae bacterium]
MSGGARAWAISKDTQVCISLSGRPSNIGTRFHNYLYDELGLDYLYKAFTTSDIVGAITGVRALGIRGCAISMPWKQDVIPLVDVLDSSARVIDAVNTIVNDGGRLTAYNTDYLAVRTLLGSHGVAARGMAAVVGSGGMARAALAALRDHGFADGVVVARSAERGRELADRYGWRWVAGLGDTRPQVVLNATPVGMAPAPGSPDHSGDLPVDADVVCRAAAVVDVVANPAETPLVRLARQRGIPVTTGAEIIALQAAAQFELYTGVRPSDEQVARASASSRA